jgi:hypothetical protein
MMAGAGKSFDHGKAARQRGHEAGISGQHLDASCRRDARGCNSEGRFGAHSGPAVFSSMVFRSTISSSTTELPIEFVPCTVSAHADSPRCGILSLVDKRTQ